VSQHPPAHQLMEPAEILFPVWPQKQLHGALMGAGSRWTCTRGWHLTLMLCIVTEEMLCTHLRIEQSGFVLPTALLILVHLGEGLHMLVV
jgi:hypothetical protein